MKTLSPNWLTEGLIDFEYKQYVLLAYLNYVKKEFDEVKLYPSLSDLVSHYFNLMKIKKNKEQLSSTSQELSKIDVLQLKMAYENILEKDNSIEEVENLVEWAIPVLKENMEEGTSLYEFVESNVDFDIVGVEPLYNKEGYMLIQQPQEKHVLVYRYKISLFENSEHKYRAINTTLVGQEKKDTSTTYHQIKLNLSNKYKELPNPATFLFASKYYFPVDSTLLPITKRILMQQIQLDH